MRALLLVSLMLVGLSLVALAPTASACEIAKCAPVPCDGFGCTVCVADLDGRVWCAHVPFPCGTDRCF